MIIEILNIHVFIASIEKLSKIQVNMNRTHQDFDQNETKEYEDSQQSVGNN